MVFRSEYLVSIPESGKASWNNITNTLIISFFFFFFYVWAVTFSLLLDLSIESKSERCQLFWQQIISSKKSNMFLDNNL